MDLPLAHLQQTGIVCITVGAAFLALTGLVYRNNKVNFDSPYYLMAVVLLGLGVIISGLVVIIMRRRQILLSSKFLNVTYSSDDPNCYASLPGDCTLFRIRVDNVGPVGVRNVRLSAYSSRQEKYDYFLHLTHDNAWSRSDDGEHLIPGSHAYFDLAIVDPGKHRIEVQYADMTLITLTAIDTSGAPDSLEFHLTASAWREGVFDVAPTSISLKMSIDNSFRGSIERCQST